MIPSKIDLLKALIGKEVVLDYADCGVSLQDPKTYSSIAPLIYTVKDVGVDMVELIINQYDGKFYLSIDHIFKIILI